MTRGSTALVSLSRTTGDAPPPHGYSAHAVRGIAAVPIDYYVIWNGTHYQGRAGSRCSRVLRLMGEAWVPHSLRDLALSAARLDTGAVRPEDVRDAIRQHQRAQGASYYLVRRSPNGDYLTVTDVPTPAGRPRGLSEGHVVLSRTGARFGAAG